jgi:hypothetical protein
LRLGQIPGNFTVMKKNHFYKIRIIEDTGLLLAKLTL